MPLRIPEDGLDNPIFEQLTDQGIHVILIFERPYPDTADDTVFAILDRWLSDDALWTGCDAETKRHAYMHETSLSSAGIWFTLVNARHPRRPLAALVQRLTDAGCPMREELYGVVEWREDRQETPSRGPDAPPLFAPGSIDEYWRACFDHGGPAPDSELQRECYEEPAEMRLSRLHVPGLRITYATPTPTFLPPAPRGREVLQAVDAAVREVFEPLREARKRSEQQETVAIPRFLDRQGQIADHVERIFRDGRAGYSLACDAEALRARYPRSYGNGQGFRFREHELMIAIRAAIVALDLEPVVMWRRFRRPDGPIGHVELQLWERRDAPASVATRVELEGRRAALIASGELTVIPLIEAAAPPPPLLVEAPELGQSAFVVAGPGDRRLALIQGDGGFALHVVGPDGPRPVDAPPSQHYRTPGRIALSADGRRAVVATPCALRLVDLDTGGVRLLVRGVGYEQVVFVAGGLVVVRGEIGEWESDPADHDLQALYTERGLQAPTQPSTLEAPAALYLLDPAAAAPLVQTISCAAHQIASVEAGRVVVVSRIDRDGWRSAILAVRGGRLALIETRRDALPDLREAGGRLVSSDAVELLNAGAAADALAADGGADLEELAPDEPGRWQLPSAIRLVHLSWEDSPALPEPAPAVAPHVTEDDRYIASPAGAALIHRGSDRLARVSAAGEVSEIVAADGEFVMAAAFPSISRDGTRALFAAEEGEQLWELDVATGATRQLSYDQVCWGTALCDDGKIALLADQDTLQIAELDGDVVRVVADLAVGGVLESWGGGRVLICGGAGADEIVVAGWASGVLAPIATFAASDWNLIAELDRVWFTSDSLEGVLELTGLEAAWQRFAAWAANGDGDFPEHLALDLDAVATSSDEDEDEDADEDEDE